MIIFIELFLKAQSNDCCIVEEKRYITSIECCIPDSTNIQPLQVKELNTYILQYEDEEGYFNAIEIHTHEDLKEFIGPMKLLKKW